MEKKAANKEKKRKIAGWSTKMLEKIPSRQEEHEHTEEMMQSRKTSQEGLDELWKELCATVEEEVLEKCKAEKPQKGAFTFVVS